MPTIDEYSPETDYFLMGNEAISRGALEAGIHFASAYPGTPSSEIIQRLSGAARAMGLHVEWSTNEKVAAEGAAAAAFAGLRSLVAMKNAGLSVALDYLAHLAYTGLGDGGAPWSRPCATTRMPTPAEIRPTPAGLPSSPAPPFWNRPLFRRLRSL